MESVNFDEDKFPKAKPKILGRDSCIAILEARYDESFSDLKQQKQADLLKKMLTKLIVIRPRQRRRHN